MFTIRIATPPDVDEIAKVVNAAFEVERPMRGQGDRTSAQNVKQLMEGGDVFFVAEDGGRVIGAVYVRVSGTKGYFGMLSVDPGQQRSGIGRALRERAEEFCLQHGCTEMTLSTGDFRTELLPYYERAGYKVVSVEPGPKEWSFSQNFQVVHMAKPLKNSAM